jgi:hypothetical protein
VVAIAEEVGATLVVVGNKGMKGVRRVLGSVPNAVAHKAPCSVLIVDTEGDADERADERTDEPSGPADAEHPEAVDEVERAS